MLRVANLKVALSDHAEQDALNEAAALAKDNLKILRDGVHPTLAGAQIISDQWLKYVEL